MKSLKLDAVGRALIDEYGDVCLRVSAWCPVVNPDIARKSEIERLITQLTDRQPADEEVMLVGTRYSLQIGAKRVRRTVKNVAKLFATLGKAWVEKHCLPSLGDIDKALEPDERAPFIDEQRILSRIIGSPVVAQKKKNAA